MKTLAQTLLPRIALYKAMAEKCCAFSQSMLCLRKEK